MISTNSSHSKNNCEGFTVKEYLQRDLVKKIYARVSCDREIQPGFLIKRVLTPGFHYMMDNPTSFRIERIISPVFLLYRNDNPQGSQIEIISTVPAHSQAKMSWYRAVAYAHYNNRHLGDLFTWKKCNRHLLYSTIMCAG